MKAQDATFFNHDEDDNTLQKRKVREKNNYRPLIENTPRDAEKKVAVGLICVFVFIYFSYFMALSGR